MSEKVLDIDSKTSEPWKEIRDLRNHLQERIVGQKILTDRLIEALIADGHLLVEGAPGLAKTKAIRELARAIEAGDHRIQFTPDLLPADLTGTDVYRPEDGSFRFEQGPLFHNLVLADEINRAPAKVQSALLEAMAERQVTVGRKTYPLPELFLVMATQNPIEQEGTYPLPEAQLDRFLMYVQIGYPDADAERKILSLVREEARGSEQPTFDHVSQKTIFAARREALDLFVSPAWLEGADFVTPDHVQAVAKDVLRHRILLTFEAEADGQTTDGLLDTLIQKVPLA